MISEIGKAYLVHGCKGVAFMARNAEKLQEVVSELNALSPKGKCIAVPGDVRKAESCAEAVKAVLQEFGCIDILVNGAAGNFLASASKLSTNGFRTVIEIDTLGTFNMSREVFNQAMKSQRSGTIINLSSSLHWNGFAFQSHSASGKAGVDALTKVLAVEWGPYGVRVSGIVPGYITGSVGMARLMNMDTLNNKEKTASAVERKQEAEPIPLQRLGYHQDVANAALFLASPAGSYISGYNVVVDGG